MKLDAKAVAALDLPPGKRDAIIFDSELAGFGVRLRQGEGRVRKTWIAQYRAKGRRTRRVTWAFEKLTPAQAREAARKILARVALGEDPQGEKENQRTRSERSFRTAVRIYLSARESEWRPASRRIAALYLTGPYFRPLHPRSVGEITRADVATCIRAIMRKHSGPTAAAARRALSAFFAWAIADGLLGNNANPVDGSHRPDDPTPREHVLSDPELVSVWNACGEDDFGRIIRLLILLGSRRQEVGGMRWSELNLDAGTWALPRERAKNRRALTVALPPTALAIIKSVPQTNRDHLFGDRADEGFTSWEYGKRALAQRLAGVRPFRLHDLRRSAATKMADIGVEPHVVEACLNHYSGHRAGPHGVYNRARYERAMKAALAQWDQHVCALVEGRAPGSNVVPMQR